MPEIQECYQGAHKPTNAEGGNTPFTALVPLEVADRKVRKHGGTVVNDYAHVHQGDNINNHYYIESQPQENKYKTLRDSLLFDRIDARLSNISTALPKTCQWLFTHEQFAVWEDPRKAVDHHGFLWIKGKPGSGKSTIMKNACAQAKKRDSSQIVISFFFNARATDWLEKSSLGLYRSLVHQVLAELPEVRTVFLTKFANKAKGNLVEEWTATELQEFLVDIVTSSGLSPITIFVDALDEGDETDIRQMVAFFEELGLHAISTLTRLRICLSSRHYPHITIRTGLSIVLEDQPEHDSDIGFYVQNKLHGDQSLRMNSLRQEVCQKSAGVFLWVILVVPMLNTIHDRGYDTEVASARLKEIPIELDALFSAILAKSTEDMESCVSLLQWVLFSKRPLSPTELYLAIQYSYASAPPENIPVPSHDRLHKYLLHCSRGLVELTASISPTIQFIHETVRGFLVSAHGLAQVNPANTANIEGSCHDKLKRACLRYIRCPEVHPIHSQWKMKAIHEELLAILKESFPFLEYAVSTVLQHADTAQARQCSQTAFVEVMSENANKDLMRWVQFHNCFESYSTRFYTVNVSLLYVAAECNLLGLARCLIEKGVDVNAPGERYGNALQAASSAGHERMVRLLLENNASTNVRAGEHSYALVAAILGKHHAIVTLLRSYDASLTTWTMEDLLFKCASRGYTQGVETLLDMGANINGPNRKHGSVLSAASHGGHDNLVQMLLEKGADVNAHGGYYSDALQTALFRGHNNVAQMLIDKGANVNAQAKGYGSVLQAMSWFGYEDAVHMLLERGANVNAPAGFEIDALQGAAYNGHEKILEMLLEMGADINASGTSYGSALQAASCGGHLVIVQMLLEKGADPNAEGGSQGSALHLAVRFKYYEIAQLLRDNGARSFESRKEHLVP